MDINKLITTIMRLFGRKLMNTAINKGIDFAARRGKTDAQMTDADRAQAQSGRDMAKRAQKMARASRRLF